jgi:hypothetical protein
MKQIPLLLLIAFTAGSSFSQTAHRLLEVPKVELQKPDCVEIPVSFSHERVSESKSLQALRSAKISKVELIYTRYQSSGNFDQQELNEDRMHRLKELLPQLKTTNPEIVWIEQTGAKTREEATAYFHGFRIYTDKQYRKTTKDFQRISREDPGNPASVFTVDNTTGGTFVHPSGTQLHIPAHAATYSDGKRVIGNYTVSYREYRDAAEIVFSGIPMNYHDQTGTYQFNSAGMYEIRGTQNGKELALQQDITVDFQCTKNEAGVHFYGMNDQTGDWKLLKSNLFDPQPVVSGLKKNDTTIVRGLSKETRYKRGIAPDSYNPEEFNYNLVYGLQSPYFGVFNCDQIYRIANPVVISPKYRDAANHQAIKKAQTVFLIEKVVNGAFTFSPEKLTCNSRGQNIFLLFTEDGKIYALKSEKDHRLNLDQTEPEFLMEEITDQVKTSDDLKHYLYT